MRYDLKEINELPTLEEAIKYFAEYKEDIGNLRARLDEIREQMVALNTERDELELKLPYGSQGNDNYILKRIGELALIELSEIGK